MSCVDGLFECPLCGRKDAHWFHDLNMDLMSEGCQCGYGFDSGLAVTEGIESGSYPCSFFTPQDLAVETWFEVGNHMVGSCPAVFVAVVKPTDLPDDKARELFGDLHRPTSVDKVNQRLNELIEEARANAKRLEEEDLANAAPAEPSPHDDLGDHDALIKAMCKRTGLSLKEGQDLHMLAQRIVKRGVPRVKTEAMKAKTAGASGDAAAAQEGAHQFDACDHHHQHHHR